MTVRRQGCITSVGTDAPKEQILRRVVADQGARYGHESRLQFDEALIEQPIRGAGDWYRDGFAHSTPNGRDHCTERTRAMPLVLHR